MAMARPPLGLVRMSGRCVLEMLRCEEVLLRRSPRSWCLVNDGVDAPTVVLGLSGKVDQLIVSERISARHPTPRHPTPPADTKSNLADVCISDLHSDIGVCIHAATPETP